MHTPLHFFSYTKGIVIAGVMSIFCLQTLRGQQLCDSLVVDSVSIMDDQFHITVYNSSTQTIIYPYFTTTLEDNPYVSLTDTFLVLSLLSVPGDFWDGYTTAWYSAEYVDPATVPMHTEIFGTLTIGDPNDSTFLCELPFSFFYGTMPTAVTEVPGAEIHIFPNPSEGQIQLLLSDPSFQIRIFDQQGKAVEFIQPDASSIQLTHNIPGLYFVMIYDAQGFYVEEWVVR